MPKQKKAPGLRENEFSSQSVFLEKFVLMTGKLSFLENSRLTIKQVDFERFKKKLTQDIEIEELAVSEQELIYGILDLFALKHGIGSQKILLEKLRQKQDGKMVGFIGPLGVAKSIMAKSLANDFKVDQATVEPYDSNPFWNATQENPEKYSEFMLRSQIFYLVSNINSDIKTRLNSKINISDTSTLADILMWVEWYHETGRFNDNEYQTYQGLVSLLKPIIPKPDLLVALKPDLVENLKTGVYERAQAEPNRSGELMFTAPDNQDLAVQVELMDQTVEKLGKDWQVPVLKFEIDPRSAYKDPEVRYDIIYQIREKLGLLGHFLNPQPREVARRAIHLMSSSDEKQVIIIHSESMFSGKTTAECIIADTFGVEKVLIFQPKAALRSDEKGFEDQEKNIISRDGLRLEAQTIENNSLSTIKEYINSHQIDPKKRPYIFIDEVMLFTAHKDRPNEAIQILEDLRQMGFHLILDGIDYTFQGEPFTFMFDLLKKTNEDKNWHQIQTSTKCRHCKESATGTRLWLTDKDGTKQLAPYNFDWEYPGNKDFEPVCDKGDHQSCCDRPVDFVKQKLPV